MGLGIASLCPAAQVTAVELSDDAMPYLRRNMARYPAYAVQAVRADVLRDAAGFTESYDAIVSNPPYIPAQDIPALMPEVQREPRMALNGGEGDGLTFYRAIAAGWVSKLTSGGMVAVEVGVGQADAVQALWRQAGLTDVRAVRDWGGIERVVAGVRP